MHRAACLHTVLATALFLLSGLSPAHSVCPNSCSGHGTCGDDDVCHCYQNWGSAEAESGDCSQRYCPYELSFVSRPNEYGSFHHYLECAGAGVCDRSTGECQCFDGYSGKGCQRVTCHGELEDRPGVFCNGHGTCEFIDELGFGSHPGVYYDGTGAGNDGAHSVKVYDSTATHFEKQAGNLWEKQKMMTCKCDFPYFGADCTLRPCARGNDVWAHRLNPTDELKYHRQNMTIYGSGPWGNGTNSTVEDFYNHTFALTFTSRINETYTTDPIEIKDYNDVSMTAEVLAEDVARFLMALPHQLIDRVHVNATLGYDIIWGQEVAFMSFMFKFTGKHTVGDQNLLHFKYKECIFCTPQLGMNGQLPVLHILPKNVADVKFNNFVREVEHADWNDYECGRRGKCDYDTGYCDCYEGWVGEACDVQNMLL